MAFLKISNYLKILPEIFSGFLTHGRQPGETPFLILLVWKGLRGLISFCPTFLSAASVKRIFLAIVTFFIFFDSCNQIDFIRIPLSWEFSQSRKEDSLFQSLEKEFKPAGKDVLGNSLRLSFQKRGYAWFKTKFILPEGFRRGPVSIILQKFQWEREVFINGHLLTSNLNKDRHWNYRGVSEKYLIPELYVNFEKENTLLVKLYYEEDLSIPSELIISREMIPDSSYYLQNFSEKYLGVFLSLLCLFLCFLHFRMYFLSELEKQEHKYILLSFLFFALTFCYTYFTMIHPEYPENLYTIVTKLEFLFYFASLFYLYKFISIKSKISKNEIESYIIEIYSISGVLLFLFTSSFTSFPIPSSIKYFLHIPILLIIILKISWGASKLIPLCRVLYPLSIVLIIGIIFNFINLFSKFTNFSPENYLIFLILIVSSSHQIFENIRNHNLFKHKYLNSENILKDKFNLINELQFEIDNLNKKIYAEYYILGILSEPFLKSQLNYENYTFNFYIEQKNNFIYKNKRYEVGGDLCLAKNISLNNKSRKYIFYINMDATGKSTKGCIGMISAGIYFEHILKQQYNLSPSDFLMSSLQDLNALLKIYDGNLFLSCSAGVIDEISGLHTYCVLGHPKNILVRDNRADYLPNQQADMLGSPNLNQIQVFENQLQKHDRIFISSDGRESLELGGIYGGARSDTEGLFLSLVEKSGGDFQKILSELRNYGRFSDDFSMLCFECLGVLIEDESVKEDEFFDKRIKGDSYFHIKNYERALELYFEVLEVETSKDLYYKIGVSYKNLKDYDKALEFFQKAIQLDSNNITLILQISDTYRLKGNIKEAQDIFKKLEKTLPQLSKIIKLNDLIEVTEG